MKINRKELLDILGKVSPALGKSGTKSALSADSISNFIFTGDGVMALNESLFVSYPFETDFKANVPSKGLFGILSESKEDEMDFSVDENKLRLNSPTMKTSLNLQEEAPFISAMLDSVVDDIGNNEFENLPADFLKALSICYLPTSAFFHFENNTLYAYESYRGSIYILDGIKNFVAEQKIAKILPGYEVDAYLITESWAHFCNADGVVISAKLLNPPNKRDISRIEEIYIENKNQGKELSISYESLIDEIKLCSVLGSEYSEKQKHINIQLRKDGEIIVAASNEYGEIEKTSSSKYRGEEIDFHIDPSMLIQAISLLGKSDSKSVIIDCERMLLFEFDNFRHILMKKTIS